VFDRNLKKKCLIGSQAQTLMDLSRRQPIDI